MKILEVHIVNVLKSRMLRLALLIDRISIVAGSTAAMLVLPLGLIMTYEALARFTFNLPTFWAYELSYMLTGAHFALGIALVTRNNGHIRIDFFVFKDAHSDPANIRFEHFIIFRWTAHNLGIFRID